MWGSLRGKLGHLGQVRWLAVGLAVTTVGLAGCGDDDGDETTAPDTAAGNARAGAPNLDRFLMRKGEEPGFRPGALPGALPRSRETITGVRALVRELGLTQADARRLRSAGFIAST